MDLGGDDRNSEMKEIEANGKQLEVRSFERQKNI